MLFLPYHFYCVYIWYFLLFRIKNFGEEKNRWCFVEIDVSSTYVTKEADKVVSPGTSRHFYSWIHIPILNTFTLVDILSAEIWTSSDVDLIFIYILNTPPDPGGAPRGAGNPPHEENHLPEAHPRRRRHQRHAGDPKGCKGWICCLGYVRNRLVRHALLQVLRWARNRFYKFVLRTCIF